MNTALIYAAGFGTRMGSLTRHCPKPLLPFGTGLLMDFALASLRDAGIEDLYINIHYLAEQFADAYPDPKLNWFHEREYPLDTGGTLKALSPRLPNVILTANSDNFLPNSNPAVSLLTAWCEDVDALLLLVPRQHAVGSTPKGDFNWDGARLSRRGDAGTADYVYTGWQLIRPKLAQAIPEEVFSTNLIWDRLIDRDRIGAVIHDNDWVDIGTAESYHFARERWG